MTDQKRKEINSLGKVSAAIEVLKDMHFIKGAMTEEESSVMMEILYKWHDELNGRVERL